MIALEALDFVEKKMRAMGVDAFDAIAGEAQSAGLEVFEGNVKTTELTTSRGIGIRLFRDGHPGYAYCEKYSNYALEATIADAYENAGLTGELKLNLPTPQPWPDKDIRIYNEEIEQVTFDQMKRFCLELEQLAKQEDKRVENVPYLGASRSTSNFIIRNSNGVQGENKSASVSVGLGAVVVDGESRKMGVYSKGGRQFNFNPNLMAKIAVERGTSLLNARPIPSGEYTVLLKNRVASQLIGMFASIFFADQAQKGQSRLKDRRGDVIACAEFSLLSEPFIPEAPGSMLFDGEGVPAQKVSVIKEGKFTSFLHNLESAYRAGEQPTGNASRGYSGRVSTSFANMIVPKSKISFEEIRNSQPTVLLIEKLEGGSGCSSVSGEISIGAQGHLIKGGVVVQAVDQITLNTNFFDLLMQVQALSNEYSDSFSSVKVPDLLVDKISVAG